MTTTISCLWLCLTALVFSSFLASLASAYTDPLDVQALQALYKSLNCPVHLNGWSPDGGDPCEESWTGVSCADSSVLLIKLDGLNLTGSLGLDLYQLRNLKQLDVSSNNISGDIPYGLPLNLTHLNLASNNFIHNIPYSLTSMKNLRHMNVSHNSLSGPIGDVFTGLTYLREMDLSYNIFTGDLPTSFGTLKNLIRLYLQSNNFTGSVINLANLQLIDLNIQDNNFSGIIPRQFQSIHNLWFGGNKFDKAEHNPPWEFPFDSVPNLQNISSPPSTESSAIKSYLSNKADERKNKRLGPGGIALTVGGATFVATCAALFFVARSHRKRARMLARSHSCEIRNSLPVTITRAYAGIVTRSRVTRSLSFLFSSSEWSSTAAEDSPDSSSSNSPPLIDPSNLPSIRTKVLRVNNRISYSGTSSSVIPLGAKLYTVDELQFVTNSFNQSNLLGEGSLGSVYKAEFPHGEICAVKIINTVSLSLHEEEQFLDVIWTAARLRHPNIVKLLGYCIGQGQHIIVYEYIRNLSLDDALHSKTYMPLPWGIRLGITLAIARALNYLHSVCKPPMAHSNLKAANILLDEDLVPHICDSGLAVLKPLTSNSVKIKASEMAISDTGYIAPEEPGSGNIKGDVYAFGVLLLEILTGRKPFDSCRPMEEQSLVKWASSRLHDNESLEKMVDPSIRNTVHPISISRFADVVSLCVQPEKEFRPSMTEIVESLMRMVYEQPKVRENPADVSEADPFDRSFRSSQSRFFSSPTVSFLST